jgi:hypothetical protein
MYVYSVFLSSLSWHLKSSKKSSNTLAAGIKPLFLRNIRALQKV